MTPPRCDALPFICNKKENWDHWSQLYAFSLIINCNHNSIQKISVLFIFGLWIGLHFIRKSHRRRISINSIEY